MNAPIYKQSSCATLNYRYIGMKPTVLSHLSVSISSSASFIISSVMPILVLATSNCCMVRATWAGSISLFICPMVWAVEPMASASFTLAPMALAALPAACTWLGRSCSAKTFRHKQFRHKKEQQLNLPSPNTIHQCCVSVSGRIRIIDLVFVSYHEKNLNYKYLLIIRIFSIQLM